jgi:hypothetical protein
MDGWKKAGLFTLLGLLLTLAFNALARAEITNEGNGSVTVEVSRKNQGPQISMLSPGQSIALPSDATEIIAPAKGRGDELIKVKVTEKNGRIGYLTELGGRYILGREEDEETAPVLTEGEVVNDGNISVDMAVRRKGNLLPEIRALHVGQPVAIPADTVEVELLSNRFLRGDEIIRVVVLMPDGNKQTIESLGAKAKLAEA